MMAPLCHAPTLECAVPGRGDRKVRVWPRLSLLFFVLHSALGMPSNEVIWTFHQPDGTSFQARVVGDEYFAFYETPDGSVIEQDAQSRNWYYAKPSADGALQRTDLLVGGAIPKGTGLNQEKEAWLEVNTRLAAQEVDEQAADGSEVPRAASSGFVKGVMLFANFSDTTTTLQTPISTICSIRAATTAMALWEASATTFTKTPTRPSRYKWTFFRARYRKLAPGTATIQPARERTRYRGR